MRLMTIVGTRPEFIQTAPFSKRARALGHTEILVHTGQHYDSNMSDVFFADLELPAPCRWLGVGGGSHAEQTGEMLIRLERAILEAHPEIVVVFGDTNSTVAGALAAAKLGVPVAHIEAGLRSFDRTMPEEINRVVTDHLSDLLLAPTETAMVNLSHEGLADKALLVGDVRVDLLRDLKPAAAARWPALRTRLGLAADQPFALATIHRASNTDDERHLRGIVGAFNALPLPVVLPVHPRLRKMLGQWGLELSAPVIAVEPLGYLDMLTLLDACAVVITDSGGLQKEAYMLRRPLVTVRDTTEWTETVEAGWNRLCDTSTQAIQAALAEALQPPPSTHPDYYGTSGVCDRILAALEQSVAERRPEPGAQGQLDSMTKATSLTLILPAFNEADGVAQTAEKLRPVLANLRLRYEVDVVFVNDGSRDDTATLLQSEFADDGAIQVVSHEYNKGLGAAIRTGFQHARGDILVTTDFDGTYDFAQIGELVEALESANADIATASPYHPQGRVEGVPQYRLLFSRGASLLYRLLVSWRIHTWTALFRAYRRPVIERIGFASDGFLAGTEILVNALRVGFSVVECPMVLRQRTFGQSSIRIARVTLAHLKYQFRILFRRYRMPTPAASVSNR